MKKVTLNVRLPLHSSLVSNKSALYFCNQDVPVERCDYQVIDEHGKVLIDFSNSGLEKECAIEDSITIEFNNSIRTRDFLKNLFAGNYKVVDEPTKISLADQGYILTNTGVANTFYFCHTDRQALDDNWSSILDDFWQYFLSLYSSLYKTVVLNIKITDIYVFQDIGVVKIVTTGVRNEVLTQVKPSKEWTLNRLFPS